MEDMTKGTESQTLISEEEEQKNAGASEEDQQTSPSDADDKAGEGDKEEDKKGDDKSGEGEDDAAQVTFEKLTLPEGFDTEDPLAGRFLEVVNKDYESKSERAQALIDLHKDIVAEYEAGAQKAFLDTQNEWQDKLIEEHGEKPLDEKLGKVAQLIDTYDQEMRESSGKTDQEFGQELREAMALTGAGNNPAIVNFLIRLAEQQSEGSPLSGAPTGGAERSRAEKLFG